MLNNAAKTSKLWPYPVSTWRSCHDTSQHSFPLWFWVWMGCKSNLKGRWEKPVVMFWRSELQFKERTPPTHTHVHTLWLVFWSTWLLEKGTAGPQHPTWTFSFSLSTSWGRQTYGFPAKDASFCCRSPRESPQRCERQVQLPVYPRGNKLPLLVPVHPCSAFSTCSFSPWQPALLTRYQTRRGNSLPTPSQP